MSVELENKPVARFPLTAWLSLVAMLVIVGVAGFLLYQRVFGTVAYTGDLVEIGGPARRAADFVTQPRVRPDGVRTLGNNIYQVKAGEGLLSVSRNPQGQWNLNFTYDRPDLVTPEQQAAFAARFRLSRDAAYAKQLNVTEEQLNKLKELAARPGMIVSDADRQRITQLFEEYVKAPQPRDAQTATLVAALREVANNSLAPTRQSLAELANQINAILKPEQIQPFRR